MQIWTDETKKRQFARVCSPSDLFALGADWMCWPAICKAWSCSRTTAMRCLRAIEAERPSTNVLYILIRCPGHPARTRRAGNVAAVNRWFENRRSVGNPNFTDSGYQSGLASRPRTR